MIAEQKPLKCEKPASQRAADPCPMCDKQPSIVFTPKDGEHGIRRVRGNTCGCFCEQAELDIICWNQLSFQWNCAKKQTAREAFEAGRERVSHPDFDFIYETFKQYWEGKK